MRVLFFADAPHRFSGAQKSLLISLTHLPAFGVEPVVAVPFEGVFERACRAQGLKVCVVASPPSFRAFGRALVRASFLEQGLAVTREVIPFSRTLARVAEQNQVSAIHYNTPRGIILAGLAATLGGLGAVLHLRGVPAIGRPYWIASQALADRIVLVAKALRDYLAPSARGRARVVYNGVRIPRHVEQSAARQVVAARLLERGIHLPDEARLFVSVSSPTAFKGIHHLLDGASIAESRGLNAVFVCAGEGMRDRYESWLRERIAKTRLKGGLHLVGVWDDVETLLAAADATVLPSVQSEELDLDGTTVAVRGTEGLPRAVLESFAVGTPVIASRVAGVEEQVEEGKTGLLVPPGDPTAIAESLLQVAGNAERWRRGGAAAREVVAARFKPEDAARGLAMVLRETARRPTAALVERARSGIAIALDTLQPR